MVEGSTRGAGGMRERPFGEAVTAFRRYHDSRGRVLQEVSTAAHGLAATPSPPGTNTVPRRILGTMITYGYPGISLESEIDLAAAIGASVLEILPDWKSFPDSVLLRRVVDDRGLTIHSAHGCWG